MRKLSQILKTALLTGTLVLLAAGIALAGFVKISGDMPDYGAVQEFEISPDGRFVVYRAVQEIESAIDIYSVELPDGQPVRLGSQMPSGSGVASFQISPDSQRVVYMAPTVGPNVLDLHSSPIGGPATASVRLTNQIHTWNEILNYAISPDSAWVVYLSDHELTGRFELYSVPITGPISATRKINTAIDVPNGKVLDFLISPDSSRVVYRAEAETQGLVELYSVPVYEEGAPPVKLNLHNPITGVGYGYRISPDSSRVVYLADLLDFTVMELFSVPLEGPASDSEKLNVPLRQVGGRIERVFSAEISPDSQWVVYRFMGLDDEAFTLFDLYSVPLEGPAEESIRLHEPFIPKGGVLGEFMISPDSSRVVFLALDIVIVPGPSLFSVPIRESQAVKLNAISYPEGWVVGMRISPDSQQVVYWFNDNFRAAPEWFAPQLYSIPIDGPASESVLLTSPFPEYGEMRAFEISPDSSRVVYLADQYIQGVDELFMVPMEGPLQAGVKLNPPLVEGGNVSAFSILPDSSRVVYQADQDAPGRVELFMVDNALTEVSFVEEEKTVFWSDGFVTLPVELNQASALTVQVNYHAAWDRANNGDTPVSSGTLTFPSGETQRVIEIPIPDANGFVNVDVLVVSLEDPENAALTEPSTVSVTIIYDLYNIFLPIVER
jgi:Tol biopolymer transport system component